MENNIISEEIKFFSGYLEKKSPSFFGSWDKRYFKILEGNLIIYMSKETDSEILGQILIDQISNPQEINEKDFKFILNDRDFILRAENSETKNKWLDILKKLIEFNEKNKLNLNNNFENENHLKLNGIQTISKNTLSLLLKYNYFPNKEYSLSKELLTIKGINKLLNLNDPKILSRIHYGFLYKHHKSSSIYQKRFFFIFSSRPLYNNDYINDEYTYDKKLKDWLKFDTLFYFKYEDKHKFSEYAGYIELKNSHKIEINDKDKVFYLILDVDDRVYQFYSDIKANRDIWFEVLKNSRKTAKEVELSVFKQPRNCEKLFYTYKISEEKLKEKIENDKISVVGKYEDINDFETLEFLINNFEIYLLNTYDGFFSCSPKKIEIFQIYSEIMNKEYINIITNYWTKFYDKIENIFILKLANFLFKFYLNLTKLNIFDENLNKNAKTLVKIYMKKTYLLEINVIENILKSEREIKQIENDMNIYITNGPNDLFEIFHNTFDLIKEFKIKFIYEEICKIFYECIIQYLLGEDVLINNEDIIIENNFYIAIANNSFNLIQLLNNLIDRICAEKVLTNKEIINHIQLNKINVSINMLSKFNINAFIKNFHSSISNEFNKVNYLDLNMTNILFNINKLLEPFINHMNISVQKKSLNEILKFQIFCYIKCLLITSSKNNNNNYNIENILKKLNDDYNILNESYTDIVGPNLCLNSLKILNDIKEFLEVNSYMISSSCLTLRQYLGKSFSLNVCKTIIKLRSDFNNDEKNDAIEQCKEILENFNDDNNNNNQDENYFDEIEKEINNNNNENNEIEDKNNENNENKNNTQALALDDFLNESENSSDSEDKKEEEEIKTENIKFTNNEIEKKILSDIIYEGTMKKKSHSTWQERFFQIKNGYLYWFKDKNSMLIQNKININKTLRVESHKENKFMMIVNDEENKQNKIYKFECNNEEEKTEWINQITKEMIRLNDIKKNKSNNENIYEIKEYKKVIKDLFNLSISNYDRTYMKKKVKEKMENENYFKLTKKKEEEIKKKKEKEKEEEIKREKELEKEKKERKKREEKMLKEKKKKEEKLKRQKEEEEEIKKNGGKKTVKNKVFGWFKKKFGDDESNIENDNNNIQIDNKNNDYNNNNNNNNNMAKEMDLNAFLNDDNDNENNNNIEIEKNNNNIEIEKNNNNIEIDKNNNNIEIEKNNNEINNNNNLKRTNCIKENDDYNINNDEIINKSDNLDKNYVSVENKINRDNNIDLEEIEKDLKINNNNDINNINNIETINNSNINNNNNNIETINNNNINDNNIDINNNINDNNIDTNNNNNNDIINNNIDTNNNNNNNLKENIINKDNNVTNSAIYTIDCEESQNNINKNENKNNNNVSENLENKIDNNLNKDEINNDLNNNKEEINNINDKNSKALNLFNLDEFLNSDNYSINKDSNIIKEENENNIKKEFETEKNNNIENDEKIINDNKLNIENKSSLNNNFKFIETENLDKKSNKKKFNNNRYENVSPPITPKDPKLNYQKDILNSNDINPLNEINNTSLLQNNILTDENNKNNINNNNNNIIDSNKNNKDNLINNETEYDSEKSLKQAILNNSIVFNNKENKKEEEIKYENIIDIPSTNQKKYLEEIKEENFNESSYTNSNNDNNNLSKNKLSEIKDQINYNSVDIEFIDDDEEDISLNIKDLENKNLNSIKNETFRKNLKKKENNQFKNVKNNIEKNLNLNNKDINIKKINDLFKNNNILFNNTKNLNDFNNKNNNNINNNITNNINIIINNNANNDKLNKKLNNNIILNKKNTNEEFIDKKNSLQIKLKNNKEIENVNLKNYKKLLDKNEDNKIKENKTKIFNIE